MKIEQNALFQWATAHQDEQLELLKTLAAIPAPSHHEEQRVAFITDWLKNLGVKEIIVDEALNVKVPFNCEGRDDITVYMAHTDLVFPDMTPLPVREEDGKLYAPGVGDDTANVVALMMCVKYIMTEGCTAKDPVLVVFNSCEEGLGNLKGVRQIAADYEGRIKELISFDGGYKRICVRAVGSERWKVKTTTIGGHSFGSFGNPNAIAHLAGLITKLYQQEIPKVEGRKTTYNVGTIQGGTSVNTIAQDVEMLYEYRSDDKGCLDQMRQQFFDLVDAARCDDANFELELMGERPCGSNVPEDAHRQLINRCVDAILAVGEPEPALGSSSTDSNIPLSLGIPAVTFGLYSGAKAHTREEYLKIETLEVGMKIALLMLTGHFE